MTCASDHQTHRSWPEKSCAYCLKEFQATVLRWADSNTRRFPWRQGHRSQYELVLAELLLQQTRAEHVALHFKRIVSRCPDWAALVEMTTVDLEELLRPLGLYRRRASALRALAEAVLRRGLPERASELEKLPGIGQYIARAIAAQLSKEVVAPIDTNVARVLERVFGPRRKADVRHDDELQCLALRLVPPTLPDVYLLSILDFAAAICRPRTPRCDGCPVGNCQYRSATS